MKKALDILISHPLLSIISFAVLIRIVVVLLYQHIAILPDSAGYIYLSEFISAFNLKGYTGERAPGYPLLISIANRNLSLTIALQLIGGVVTVLFTYKTLKILLSNNKQALFVTLFISAIIPWILYEFAILTESLTLTFISAVTYLFFKIQQGKGNNKRNYLYLGILCGCTILIKPFYIYLPILLYALLFIQKKFSKSLFASLSILIIPALCFLGWSYVNKINTGHFTSSSFQGIYIAQNCVYFAEKTSPEYAEIGKIYAKYREKAIKEKSGVAVSIWAAYPELSWHTKLSLPDLSKQLHDYSITTIKLNKFAYLKQVFLHSWRIFWKSSIYIPDSFFQIKDQSKILYYFSSAEQLIVVLTKTLFLLFVPMNIVYAFKRKKVSTPLLITVIVITTSLLQAFITFGGNDRFSYPFEIMMLISVYLNIVFISQKKLKYKHN